MRYPGYLAAVATLLGAVSAEPALATPYSLLTVIPIPATAGNSQGGAFTAFDISFFDPATGMIYVADRSNASVDIISGTTLSVVGQATGFTGQLATTSVSGADGVLTVTSGGVTTLYAGDGNSSLRVYNVTNPAAPALLQTIAVPPLPPGSSATRVDEMAYSPATHQLLAANNAATPAFGNLFSTNGPPATPAALTTTNITVPAGQGGIAGGGLEQPVWNPNTGSFFITVPALSGAGNPGGVSEISTAGTVLRTINFATLGIGSCAPTGLALGGSGNLLVGCSPASGFAQAILLNPAGVGSIVTTFAISGTDELWYDPTTHSYYVTGKNSSGNRVFDIISDITDTITQSVLLPVSALSNPHSITVDSLNGDVFVPLAGNTATVGGNTICPLGCVAVFSTPEPGSLPILVLGATMLLGLGAYRRWHNG